MFLASGRNYFKLGSCVFSIESGRIRHRVQFYEYFKTRLTQIVLSATRRRSNLTSCIGASRLVYFTPSRFSLVAAIVEHTVTYHLHHLFHSSSFIYSRPNLALRAPTLSLPRLFCTFYTCARIHLPSLFLSSASTLYLRECHRY